MTNFLAFAATMQTLSVAGMEEASREGRRIGDIEHVLLALVISEQSAGQVLRGLGITLDDAREAVRAQHREQLHQLGIDVESERPDRIVFHETDGYDWSERALMIMSRSTEGPGRGDGASVLRRLLDEPSGLIEAILERLGTTTDAVRAALDDVEPAAPPAGRGVRPSRDRVRGRFETFVPAAIDDVWALVSDAERVPEWEPMTGSVKADATAEPADAWIAIAPTHRPDGKPIKIKAPYRRRRLTQVDSVRSTMVVWRFGYPDAAAAQPRTLAVELSPVSGGTRIVLTSEWPRRAGWRRLVGMPLRPLQRYFVWLNLSQTGGGISRAFR